MLCVDEEPQRQALEGSAPLLPVLPGSAERASFDYVRHGTPTLIAVPEVATGRVTDACTDRHRHQEFGAFLQQVAAAYPRRELHVVVDNYATHKHPAFRAWLQRHRRVHLHFTPTSGSWLNLVEAFFSIITRQALRRGRFPTIADLSTAIERFIDAWNDRCIPFTWTKDRHTIIAKATHLRNRKHQDDVRYGPLAPRSTALSRATLSGKGELVCYQARLQPVQRVTHDPPGALVKAVGRKSAIRPPGHLRHRAAVVCPVHDHLRPPSSPAAINAAQGSGPAGPPMGRRNDPTATSLKL